MNKDSLGDRMGEVCGDNRFEIIQRAKDDLINSTNIKNSLKEIIFYFVVGKWDG